MAERPEPYVRRDPGDVIRSGDWNELQVQAREEVHGHRHTGGADGLKIPRGGIVANAIDGSLIDPQAHVVLDSLTINKELKVNGNAVLGDIADLQGRFKKLEAEKLNRAGDSVTGALNIAKELTVTGKIEAGNSELYFTNTKHNHTGFGNTEGYAAIENAENYGALMILGRATNPSGKLKRVVQLWDFLQVKGDLEVSGSIIRRIAVATGLGPNDGTDSGQIKSRVLDFTKVHTDTAIRILYCDNFRVYTHAKAGRWEIRVNGAAPPGGMICQDKYSATSTGIVTNQHELGCILGYATGLPAGKHQIQVWVSTTPGYTSCDCYTGWKNSRWTIEAEEVRI